MISINSIRGSFQVTNIFHILLNKRNVFLLITSILLSEYCLILFSRLGKASFGDQEWYFFSPRDRKYPNGARPNRAATSGYWKATGTDKPILTSKGVPQKVGVKKALVFYGGKPPKGIKTNWIMHEYRLLENNNIKPPPPTKKNSSRVRMYIYNKFFLLLLVVVYTLIN